MIKAFSISVLILLCFAVFESAILSNLLFLPAIPDFLLIFTLYVSVHNGRLFGVSAGFVSGLFLDSLSMSPLGLHCLLRTIIGYISGIFNKTLNMNGIFLPILIGFLGTLLKVLLIFVISVFFQDSVLPYSLFSKTFLFELLANSLLTPLVFKFLDVFSNVILLNPEKVS
ncbi:MAG: rod shape-determining protein MreD [Treponema sp.]|uniref:rod shape-determining protein MreD n=1 Tax=Treponema sp. TaxID=166 RepID=UPI001B6CC21F|nr:rod shape-determining protein MreD [Treponema sp.]MBP3773347.1 rod shape-determining protein MreD [Treponema sp.]MBQ9281064.1 rod shape-determining protein MreD [Treponema sp.]